MGRLLLKKHGILQRRERVLALSILSLFRDSLGNVLRRLPLARIECHIS